MSDKRTLNCCFFYENGEGVAICDFYAFTLVNRIGKKRQRTAQEYQEQGGAHAKTIALKRSPRSVAQAGLVPPGDGILGPK